MSRSRAVPWFVKVSLYASILMLLVMVAGLLAGGCSKKTQSDPSIPPPVGEPTGEPGSLEFAWRYEDEPSPALEGDPTRMLVSFGFEQGATTLKQEAIGAMRDAVRGVENKDEIRLAVIGFADGVAEKADAERLGLRRAEAVRRFLTTVGLEMEQIQVSSFGDRHSTAAAEEKIKQSHERKVEIWVVE